MCLGPGCPLGLEAAELAMLAVAICDFHASFPFSKAELASPERPQNWLRMGDELWGSSMWGVATAGCGDMAPKWEGGITHNLAGISLPELRFD